MDKKKMSNLDKDIIKYFRVRDLYNRLVEVENDTSKFTPKETDLETIRSCLIMSGVVLQNMIKKESGGEITWE